MAVSKPAVDRKTLLLISGLMWSAVGIFLNILTWRWLKNFDFTTDLELIITGMAASLVISWFGFRVIAKKNINRILAYPERVCVFAFQEWKSYIIIIVMMSMGIYFRTSGLVPKYILIPMYIGIGAALFLAGLSYYREYFNEAED